MAVELVSEDSNEHIGTNAIVRKSCESSGCYNYVGRGGDMPLCRPQYRREHRHR